ncbi:heparinase II/III family protein [Jeotgalicoccus halotolerans]|uniref:heparinase II/III domain-containing protein n=1 Tax=Jeotgalicoccus halotolerans TaxID=157227 RepID=UPI003514BD42
MKLENERKKVKAFLDNKLIVRKDFDPIDISMGINWNYSHSENANTYQTYLHSLGIITDLLRISLNEDDSSLLKHAREIIIDWHENNHRKSENYAWKEHPVSSRISNIIEFQEKATSYKLEDETFEKIIINHCEYLSEERNYKFNNHGLMMDYGLLNACKHLTDKRLKRFYADKAIYRVRYALYRDFTRKGVHLENSPEYHRLVLSIFTKLDRVIKELKLSIGKNEKELLDLSREYKSHIIQPNNYYPMIGDTGTIHDVKIEKNFNDFIDYDAGIAILNNKDTNDITNSTMLTFKSGYHKKTHKHNDDLSVTLYLSGEELLVDSGKYSYDSKDKIRQHLVSPRGHSSPCIAHKNYVLSNPLKEQENIKITKYVSKNSYKLVSGINKMYKNAIVTRHNILSENNIYFVVDRIVSKEDGLFYQNFNINENATITQIDKLTFDIKLNSKNYVLKTFERIDSDIMTDIKKGYVSRTFGEYNNNKRILVKQTKKNATFISAILTRDQYDILSNVKLSNNRLTYIYNGEKIEVII